MRTQLLIAGALALGLAACQSDGVGSTSLSSGSSAGAAPGPVGAASAGAAGASEAGPVTNPTSASAGTSPLDTSVANGRTDTP